MPVSPPASSRGMLVLMRRPGRSRSSVSPSCPRHPRVNEVASSWVIMARLLTGRPGTSLSQPDAEPHKGTGSHPGDTVRPYPVVGKGVAWKGRWQAIFGDQADKFDACPPPRRQHAEPRRRASELNITVRTTIRVPTSRAPLLQKGRFEVAGKPNVAASTLRVT